MSETTEDKKRFNQNRRSRVRTTLVEAYVADPEQAADRRSHLEKLSLIELDGQQSIAIGKLNNKLKRDSRVVKINAKQGTFDDRQLTLPPVSGIGAVTIQTGEGWDSGVVKIYTGEASELLATEPGQPKTECYPSVVIAGSKGMNNAQYWEKLARSSIRDMQGVAENIILLEALTEQLVTNATPVATQAGELAVRAGQL